MSVTTNPISTREYLLNNIIDVVREISVKYSVELEQLGLILPDMSQARGNETPFMCKHAMQTIYMLYSKFPTDESLLHSLWVLSLYFANVVVDRMLALPGYRRLERYMGRDDLVSELSSKPDILLQVLKIYNPSGGAKLADFLQRRFDWVIRMVARRHRLAGTSVSLDSDPLGDTDIGDYLTNVISAMLSSPQHVTTRHFFSREDEFKFNRDVILKILFNLFKYDFKIWFGVRMIAAAYPDIRGYSLPFEIEYAINSGFFDSNVTSPQEIEKLINDGIVGNTWEETDAQVRSAIANKTYQINGFNFRSKLAHTPERQRELVIDGIISRLTLERICERLAQLYNYDNPRDVVKFVRRMWNKVEKEYNKYGGIVSEF
jgi:hypothetical protein